MPFPAATMGPARGSAGHSDSSDAQSTHLFSALRLNRRSRFFFAKKVRISANAEEVNQHADHIPHNHGPRNNQDAIVDPEDLKDAYDRRHPWVHARTRPAPEHRQQVRQDGKGGSKPATKPKRSER